MGCHPKGKKGKGRIVIADIFPAIVLIIAIRMYSVFIYINGGVSISRLANVPRWGIFYPDNATSRY